MHVTRYVPPRDEPPPLELVLHERSRVEVEESAPCTGPTMAHTIELEAIRATSLSPARAGERLRGVAAIPGRQMIRGRAPYALRLEGRWKVAEAMGGAHSVSLCTPILAPT